MTAYARASLKTKLGQFVVEIQSVNRKFLEVNTVLPKEFVRFDTEIKKWIGELISRGQVNFKLFVNFDQLAPTTIQPNLNLARQMKQAFDLIAKDLGLKSEFTLDLIKDQKDLILYAEEFENEEEYRLAIKEVVHLALSDLVKMKRLEGQTLLADIETRTHYLKTSMEQIEQLAGDAVEKQREKLIKKLNEIQPGFLENEDRLLKEICLFAEKVDISEEITRFKSHIDQFLDLLNSNHDTIGKTLEFIIQEMNRETNTIGSKASDINISKLVIGIKSELEKIREQIQNVE